MRFQIALALSLSVLLVSAASWWRFSRIEYTKPVLATVEELEAYGISDEDFLKDFTEPAPEKAEIAQEPLSNTEIIGRQLITDYIGLATRGNANIENINVLAEQYVSVIPRLSQPEKLDYQDIKTAPNTKDGFKYYSEELGRIYLTHTEHINKSFTKETNLTLDKAYYSFAEDARTSYRQIIQELRNLAVPLPLANFHLELINTHLSSSMAMESILKAEEDPLVSFAGFVVANENSEKEIVILKEIEKILKTNG